MTTIDLLSVMTPSFKIWKMWINFYTKLGKTYFCSKDMMKSLFSILKGINHMSFLNFMCVYLCTDFSISLSL